ncbi:BA14K family protein [Mesorhizobium sp. AR10]|nr:BA14K family protein [Mesorhizobium sp. AR10]
MLIRSHGGFGGGRSFGGHPFAMSHGGFGGGRSFGSHPFVMSHRGGRGFDMRQGFNGNHRYHGRRHFGRFRDRDHADDFDGFFGFAPFLGLGTYGYDNAAGYCENYRSYDPASGTYLGRSGHRYYCP